MFRKATYVVYAFLSFTAAMILIHNTVGLPDGLLPHKKSPALSVQAAIPADLRNAYIHPMLRPTETGSYLAGRFAQKHKDWQNAYLYIGRAYGFSDRDNPETGLLDRSFLLAIINGRMDDAVALADTIIAREDAGELAHIVKAAHHLKNNENNLAVATLNEIDTEKFGGYAVPLLQSWAALETETPDAAAVFLKESAFSDDMTYNIHKALVFDRMDETEKAGAYYNMALKTGLGLQETLFAANFFERRQDWDTAEKIYQLLAEKDPGNRHVRDALERVQNRQTPAASVSTARDGLAYTLFSMAQLLAERDAYDSALIYSRLVEYLDSGSDFANVLLGDLLEQTGHYDEAIAYYNQVKPEDVLYKSAQLKRVSALETAGRANDALSLLSKLVQNRNTVTEAWIQTGDIYQRQEQFGQAVTAYNTALNSLEADADQRPYWSVIYARGMAHERLDNWDAAEKDLIKALEYNPDNPSILNYLGYSWVDKGVNLDRAMDMIRRAVALRPDDGYIIDSYGWAFYKLGDYREAVRWLEKAIEYHPEDATLNDHLGDAYWQIGRIKEARFQWERAAKFSNDTETRSVIHAKLKHGLPRDPAAVPTETAQKEAALH